MQTYVLDKERGILYLEDLVVELADVEAIELSASIGSGPDDVKLMRSSSEGEIGGNIVWRTLSPSARVRLAAELEDLESWACFDDDRKKLMCVAVNLDKIQDIWKGARGALITETYVITMPRWQAMRAEELSKARRVLRDAVR